MQTNKPTLRNYRTFRGFTQKQVADVLGITVCTYKYKEKKPETFKVSEFLNLRELLKLTDEDIKNIFFAN